jgi:PAS domain S-box-containing protein
MGPLSFYGNDNTERVGLLSYAIDSFNGVAAKFEQHYRHLEQRVIELDIELRDKNKALEKDLKEKKEILTSLPYGVVFVNMQNTITNFNRAAENITGLISEKVREKKIDDVFGPEFFSNFHLDFRSLKDIRESVEVEGEICRKGKETIYLSISISPVKNPWGERVGTVVGLQDITRMKRLEEQAIRADRLGGMEKMAEKIAHDIRNPLGSIELIASVLRKDLEDFGELRTLAEHISSGVQSINNIVSNLLLFISPKHKPDLQVIDIRDILDDSLFFTGHLFKSNDGLEVITRYTSKPLMILADPELLKQVYLNLILNAIQAMPDNGKLIISTKEIHGQQKMQNSAEIRFADTGIGISREDMVRIFDPFFTTKEKGAGLGLTIAHNITKIHCGSINISSSKDEGTVCTVTLPLWDGDKAQNCAGYGVRCEGPQVENSKSQIEKGV